MGCGRDWFPATSYGSAASPLQLLAMMVVEWKVTAFEERSTGIDPLARRQ
jgi:hypothetical protein